MIVSLYMVLPGNINLFQDDTAFQNHKSIFPQYNLISCLTVSLALNSKFVNGVCKWE